MPEPVSSNISCGAATIPGHGCQKPPMHGIPHEWRGIVDGNTVHITWWPRRPEPKENP